MAFSPGPTRTDFYRASSSSERGVRFQSPEQVVRAALRALDRRRTPVSSVSGRANAWTSRIVTVLPRRMVLRLASSSPAQSAV
jgi:short-subunit dehydrogenase